MGRTATAKGRAGTGTGRTATAKGRAATATGTDRAATGKGKATTATGKAPAGTGGQAEDRTSGASLPLASFLAPTLPLDKQASQREDRLPKHEYVHGAALNRSPHCYAEDRAVV